MRETSGLGEPPSNITARSFLPVRSAIVFTGSRGTGLIGFWSSLAAFLSLTNGYAAKGIHSSVSNGSESGIGIAGQQSTLFYLWTSPSQGNTSVYHIFQAAMNLTRPYRH